MAAFGALALATVAAVFITQHLKVTTPLIAGAFGPTPPVLCPHARTQISFELLHSADDINLYVVNHDDTVVRTLVLGVPGGRKQTLSFSWNGHDEHHRRVPRGTYNFRVVLIHQHRTIDPLLNQVSDTPMTVTVRSSC
jgi:flagellar hook assembly protein FlgD